jgi:hypothetical protein
MMLIEILMEVIVVKRWEDASLAETPVGYQVPFIILGEL